MPRQARLFSSTGVYHVMLRGINKQAIFLSQADNTLFLRTLKKYKRQCNIEIIAYCLMTNHIHLLLKTTENSTSLETFFKKLGTAFVFHYNEEHQRVGHLFQDRFRSEPVETEQYFKTVFRYILQNPLKAGLEKSLGDYPWTSFGAYKGDNDNLTDTQFALSVFSSPQYLLDYTSFLAHTDTIHIHAFSLEKASDSEALHTILSISKCSSISEFKGLSQASKTAYIKQFLEKNISQGQIVRITGVSKDKVSRIKRNCRQGLDI